MMRQGCRDEETARPPASDVIRSEAQMRPIDAASGILMLIVTTRASVSGTAHV